MEKFLKINEVEEMVGMKKSWIYDEPNFPAAIPIGETGTAKRWALSQIQGWMSEQIQNMQTTTQGASK